MPDCLFLYSAGKLCIDPVRVCVSVCVCVAAAPTVCVCVCVCVRERDRERQRQTDKKTPEEPRDIVTDESGISMQFTDRLLMIFSSVQDFIML